MKCTSLGNKGAVKLSWKMWMLSESTSFENKIADFINVMPCSNRFPQIDMARVTFGLELDRLHSVL